MILVAVIAIIVAVLVFLIFAAYVGYRMVTPPRLIGKWSPRDFGFDYTDEEFSSENLKLKGWFIDRNSDLTIIPLHGYTVSRWDEVYMKDIIKILAEEGFNVFAFDFRAHGESEGKHTTLGDKEIKDVMSAIDFLNEKYPEKCMKIGIIGYSMGGAIALKIAALENRVACAVADSPFVSMEKTGPRGLKYFANLPKSLYGIVKIFSSSIAKANLKELEIINYADKIKVPVLIIAGKRDPLVTVKEVEEFRERAKDKVELWITSAEHVRSIKDFPEEYKKKIVEFFRRNMSQ